MSPQGERRAVEVLVTCEHGGNRVPQGYRSWFTGAREILDSHRGWDPGALPLAEELARRLDAPLRSATVTRLLVDLNRSPHNPRVFSEFSRGAPREERRRLLEEHHAPHRSRVEEDVASLGGGGATVLHLGIHSFTPSWNGAPRRPELALLYDPARPLERALCRAWVRRLEEALPGRAIRRNDPYRGAADGLTTWLRRGRAPARYLGVEVEVSQGLLDRRGRFPGDLTASLAGSLVRAVEDQGWHEGVDGPY